MRLSLDLKPQLPPWARLTHPVLRSVLQRERRRRTPAGRALAALVGGGMVLGMLYAGADAYRRGLALGVSSQGESPVFSVLYLLLLFVQLFAQLAALLLASSLLAGARQRESWELVRVTSHGAEMAVWARWAAVFFQLRWVLGMLVVPRLFFAARMLAGVADYHGHQLDLAIMGITPGVSIGAAIGLLAALMAAALLQPVVSVALNAAAGLLLAVVFGGGRLFQVARTVAVVMQVGVFGVALSSGWVVLNSDPLSPAHASMSMGERWSSLFLLAVGGDQSLRFMNLQTTLRAWADVEYGVLLGAAILAVVVVEALLAGGVVGWAARRAGRPVRA